MAISTEYNQRRCSEFNNKVLCTYIWYLQESNGQGKLVSKSTHARHLLKQQNTWPNSQIPVQERHLVTPIFQNSSTIVLTLSAVPVVILCTNQGETNQNCINIELNNLFSHNYEILNSEKEYAVCNIDNNEYNDEYDEKYNSEYNEKDDGEYNDKYNNKYNENSKEENEEYNEKYDNNGYDDEEYNEEYNEECSNECSEEFDIEGIQYIDGVTEETFILHTHILSWSGDILALIKVMCTTGHNSYKACRFCSICGICCKENRHIYFLLKPPNGVLGCLYKPKNLPL
ncbi:17058_t:CDS:2 [Racocetra persica]|uniref:17058_t:CDS:1 n=1 Tax=Racocetra persica TaxID=160502 RepID=A0ACA9KM88_9GLOM|nr:17058_t:CDS:2 [Racocetra persica]